MPEDNPQERLILSKALGGIAGVSVVAQASTGGEAIALVEKHQPDVVFLDMDLPERHGLDIAREIADNDPQMFIIFATGYSSCMSEAFEVYAFDYFLKPYKVDRLRETMERIKQLAAQRKQPVSNRGKVPPAKPAVHRNIGIKTSQGWIFVSAADILLVTRTGRKTRIITRKKEFMTNEPLTELEGRLGGPPFLRCHKGYIVNMDYASNMIPWGRSTYQIHLEGTSETALATLDKAREIKTRFHL